MRTVLGLFAGLLVVFVGQLAVSRTVGEPYPGLFQPSFGGPVPAAGTAMVQEPEITATYTDGSVLVLTHREVMARSALLPLDVFRAVFGPDNPRRSDPETVAWLGHRLAELGDGRAPDHAVVEWREVEYALDGQQPPRITSTDRELVTFGARG